MALEMKWIKIVTDIFDDEKIKLIETYPDSSDILLVWFKVLCLAGKLDQKGVLKINDRICYTPEMLAVVFRLPEEVVKKAIKIFEDFEMIEIVDGAIVITNWGKHQQLDALDNKRKYQRELMQKRREEQKKVVKGEKLDDCDANSDANSDANVDANGDATVSSAEKEKEYIYIDSNESICRTGDVRRVKEAWNALGIGQVTTITSDTARGRMLKARIAQHGTDKIIDAINSIKDSPFLLGQNKQGWMITFDWFVKPNNFLKVLEGNYKNRAGGDAGKENTGGFDDV